MASLTAAEIVAHPAYRSVEWNLPPTTSGKCLAATNRRGGPFNLHYEIHGTGPMKLVWVMGLGATSKDWKRQTKYFGHDNASKYSCLVFDNRGIGRSDKPTTFYSTSEMARDAIDLLTHVGWLDLSATPSRSIHVIGVSMGGMISQELAMLIPDRLASLTLCCTAPRLVRTTPFFENLRERAQMFIPCDFDEELRRLAHSLFDEKFLDQSDLEFDDPNKNFPTRRDRFAAGRLLRREDPEAFPKKGFLMQVVACYFHHKSAAQLKALGDAVGRERIALLHGTIDRMLTFPHGEMLRKELGDGIVWKVFVGAGHMLPWEREAEVNQLIEELVQKHS